MWGCEFAKKKKSDPELAEFLKSFQFVPPLEPRDAFFGGRTGAATLYSKAGEGEDISYIDYTSLYPAINKYGTYPVGFPARKPKYSGLLWNRPGRHSRAGTSVPSRLARKGWRETYFSSLQIVRGRRARKTPP